MKSGFPRFRFRLTKTEYQDLEARYSFEKPKYGGRRHLPYSFTEYGAMVVASVLNGPRAIHVQQAVVRAFIQLRESSHETRESLEARVSRIEDRFSKLEERQVLVQRVPTQLDKQTLIEKPLTSKTIVPEAYRPNYEVEKIQSLVAKFYGISRKDLKSVSRKRTVALPRQVAMYLTRKNTEMSFGEIGFHFSGKDHTTIMHGYEKIEALMRKDVRLKAVVEALQRQISEPSASMSILAK